MTRLCIAAIAATLLLASKPAQGQEDCFVTGYQERVQCHSVTVPLDWANDTGDTIDLFVAVIPAKAATPAPDPLLFLAGGPGQAAAELAFVADTFFSEVLERRDIVLMDRRGTGKSVPLQCEFIDEDTTVIDPADIAERARACLADYGTDPRHFSAPDVTQDIEAVRQALNIAQFNLYGGSYGTRAGLLYMRAYPDAVRTATLDAVVGPEVNLFEAEPLSSQRALDKWDARMPGLSARLNAILAAHETPQNYAVRDVLTGEAEDVRIDASAIAGLIRALLYSPALARQLPLLLEQLEAGNPEPLFAAAGGFVGTANIYYGAMLSSLCREEIPRIDDDALARAAAQSFTGRVWSTVFTAACTHWPTKPLDAGYGARVISDIPTLLISGDLDPVTPPGHAESALQGLSNAKHLVVTDGGHINAGARCIPKQIAQFIRSADLDTLDPPDGCLSPETPPSLITAFIGPEL